MPLLVDKEDQQAPKSGLILLQCMVLGLFLIFTMRLWYLQIHQGEHFEELARENQMRQEFLYAPRGLIRDRTGKLLAVNQPAYALALVRESCDDVEALLQQVSAWTGIPYVELKARYETGIKKVKPFQRLILAPDISYELLALIEANAVFWPGLEIVVRPRRFYPQGALMAHIMGYVAEANEEELEADEELSLGDVVGKAGVEFVFEDLLRGGKGLVQLEVDATGRHLANHVLKESLPGQDLRLSIDLDLQTFAMQQLEGESGAVVVLEPFTGQVLALVTQPSYDNNAFEGGLSHTQWNALRDHPRHPLQNRVIQSVYPPGSVWKLLMAACALNSDIVKPNDTVYCPGYYQLGKRVFRCWRAGGHGAMNLRNALINSCDVYFYQMGERLGVDRISEYAFSSGFGELTGIDLPSEKPGLVPTREWKLQRFNEPWQGGENLNLAIGQGFTLVTPLQVARYLGALVNGGFIMKPNLQADADPVIQGRLDLSDKQRQIILDAMEATVTSGTARRVYRPDVIIGGKTGTAQVITIGEYRRKKEDMPYEHRDHAWLATWAQQDGRYYVVVVMIEHGGHGSSGAGPVVKSVYEHLFGSQ